MNRRDKLTLRANPAEAESIRLAAREAGLSVSEFLRRAAKAVKPEDLRDVEPAFAQVPIPRRRSPSRRALDEVQPFRTPFFRGTEGYGFERSVRHAARMMGIDDATMAMALTHFFEALANAVASGQVVRIPGVFAVGPYKSTSKVTGEDHVYPRFQAAPPMSRDVDARCPTELARNEEMDKHFRRSRREGVQNVREVMDTIRRAIVNQDLRALRAVEDHWRCESEAHAV